MRKKPQKKAVLDLAAAARALRRAMTALGGTDDPAGRLVEQALRNVQLRLDSGEATAVLVLHSAQTVTGRRWQLRRAGRVWATWPAEGPEAVSLEEARRRSEGWAREFCAQLVDKTARTKTPDK